MENKRTEYIHVSNEESDSSIEQVVQFNVETSHEDTRKCICLRSCVSKCCHVLKIILSNCICRVSIGIFFTILWTIYYIFSLEGCSKQQAECLQFLNQDKVLFMGKLILFSSLCFMVLFLGVIFKYLSKYFLYFNVLSLIFLFYFYDTGADFASHGAYNRVAFYICISLEGLCSFIVFIFIKLVIKRPIIVLTLTAAIIYFTQYKIEQFIAGSCDYWDKGFKDTQLINGGNCRITYPKRCWLNSLKHIFDMTALRGLECASARTDDEFSLKAVSNKPNVKRLGFPRTEHWNFFPESTFSEYNKNIFKNMIDMDDPNMAEEAKNVEVVIDYTTGYYPEVKIDVKHNKTLADERKKLSDINKDKRKFKNVIIVYLDALARNHFRRQLTKTYKWLENLYDNNEPENKYASYQFLKYHSIHTATFMNMVPGYFGVYGYGLKADYILYDYKANGFITGQPSNVCERENWDLEMAFQPFLNFTNYDHEFNPFFCDPLFSDPDAPYHIFKGAYSITRKCMYGKDAGAHQVEYAKQFMETYKDQPKFFRMIFSDAHEGTQEVVKYLDDHILNFLEFLKTNNHLDESLLIVISDHGDTMPGPYAILQPDDLYIELLLPTLIYVIPKNIPDYYDMHNNLKANEHVMVTSYDFNAGLRYSFNKDTLQTEKGVNLFKSVVKEYDRSCEFFRIHSYNCLCYS